MTLKIKNLEADLEKKKILKGINLDITQGKIHAIMGPNGSGKSTLAQVIMGNPAYEVTNPKSQIILNGNQILHKKTEERAKSGIFLAFQNPVTVPGVSVANLLKTAYQTVHKPLGDGKNKKTSVHNPALSVWDFHTLLVREAEKLSIAKELLGRSLNDGFSGGEKKKIEMLQAIILAPHYAIFDEIDTGLDVDALKSVAMGIKKLKEKGTGVLIITHYQRILKFAIPDTVFILVDGKIVDKGSKKLAFEIEKNGYKQWLRSS